MVHLKFRRNRSYWNIYLMFFAKNKIEMVLPVLTSCPRYYNWILSTLHSQDVPTLERQWNFQQLDNNQFSKLYMPRNQHETTKKYKSSYDVFLFIQLPFPSKDNIFKETLIVNYVMWWGNKFCPQVACYRTNVLQCSRLFSTSRSRMKRLSIHSIHGCKL